MKKKLTQEEVKRFLEIESWELLDSYKNSGTPMKCKCPNGHIRYLRWNHFKKGIRCGACSGIDPMCHSHVSKFFEDQGFVLIDEYKNCSTNMKCKCSQGHISFVSWDNFSHGSRCRQCFVDKNKGSNHYRWNSNLTDEERELQSTRGGLWEVKLWRRNVFERDNYICDICKRKGGMLNAHHLNSWNTHVDERLSLENGLTLCEKCHNNFHQKFGKGNNTKAQYIEYKESVKL